MKKKKKKNIEHDDIVFTNSKLTKIARREKIYIIGK